MISLFNWIIDKIKRKTINEIAHKEHHMANNIFKNAAKHLVGDDLVVYVPTTEYEALKEALRDQ